MKKLYIIIFSFLIMKNQNILTTAPIAQKANRGSSVKPSHTSTASVKPKTMMEKSLMALKTEGTKIKESFSGMSTRFKESISNKMGNKGIGQTGQPVSSQGLFIPNKSQSVPIKASFKKSEGIDLSSLRKPDSQKFVEKSVRSLSDQQNINNKSDFIQLKIDQARKSEPGSKIFKNSVGDDVIFTTVNPQGKTIHSVIEFKNRTKVETFVNPSSGNKKFVTYDKNNKQVGVAFSDKEGNILENGQKTGSVIGETSRKFVKPVVKNKLDAISEKQPLVEENQVEIKKQTKKEGNYEVTTGKRSDATGYEIDKIIIKNKKGKDLVNLKITQKDAQGKPIIVGGKVDVVNLNLTDFSKKLKNAKTRENVNQIITDVASEFIQSPDVMKILKNDPIFKEFQSEVAAKALKPKSLDKAMFTTRALADFFTQADYGKIIKKIGKKTTNVVQSVPLGVGKKSIGYKKYDQEKKSAAGKKLDEVKSNKKSLPQEKDLAQARYESAKKQVDINYQVYTVRDAVTDISNFISKNKKQLLSKLKPEKKQKPLDSDIQLAEKAKIEAQYKNKTFAVMTEQDYKQRKQQLSWDEN